MTANDKFEYTCTLAPDTLEIAKKELNEDPTTRLLELKALRDRLLQYPGLKPCTDPQFLIRFLRARKFDQEKSFELVLNYYRMRKEDPDIFAGLKPSDVAHVYASELSYPHSYRDRLGRKVYFVNPARMEPARYTMTELFKMEFLNLNKMMEEEENQVRGFTLLLDYADFTMSHFMVMNLDFAKRLTGIWQDAFPARVKWCLIVNEPPCIDFILALLTKFLKAKIISRIRRIGTDWNTLHEYIDPEYLPERYGGTLSEETDPKSWTKLMMQFDSQMEQESKFGFVDYTLGEDVSKNKQDAITHTAGIFKKLQV